MFGSEPGDRQLDRPSELAWLQDEATLLQTQGLERRLVCMQEIEGGKIRLDQDWLWNFSSNDYLGLAGDPRVKAAAAEAVGKWGAGCGASALVCGWTRLHQDFAEDLAEFESAEAVALFPTGFAANLGAIVSLVGPGDAVYLDRLDHACLIAGAKLSGARVRVYPHADLDRLATILKRERGGYRRVLIATDGVFSMDGDLAPLKGLVDLADQFQAMTLVDEAHATGVLGPGGQGSCALLGVKERVSARVGTLSKSLGSMGGFVAGSHQLVARIHNRAPTFMFSTALAPAVVAAAQAALAIVRAEPERRSRLAELVTRFHESLGSKHVCIELNTVPIIPIMVGSPENALNAALVLRQRGFLVPAIRPPTVPRGTSRLRVSLSAILPPDVVTDLAQNIKSVQG